MRLRSSSMIVLVLSLAMISAACDGSKVDRTILALDNAILLPAALGLPPQQVTCAEEGFRSVRNAFVAMKENPTSSNWAVVKAATDKLELGSCFNNPRLVAVARIVINIVVSVTPQPTLDRDEPITEKDYKNALKRLDEADVKELERLTKR